MSSVIGAMSYAGVDIFFVISGFIVSQAAMRAGAKSEHDGRFSAAFDFAIRRIVRIFPLYWLALAVAILFGGWLGIAVKEWPESSILAMATLTTMWVRPLSAAWTLAFEVYFYAALTMLILIGGRRVRAAIFVWFALQVLWINAPRFGVQNWGIGSSELIYEFAFGWAISYLSAQFAARWWPIAILGFLAFWFAGSWLTFHDGLLAAPSRVSTFGIASAFLLVVMLGFEHNQKRVPKWLQRIGDASYSIYLWHMILFAVVYSVLPTTPTTFAIGLAALLGLGFVSYSLVEVSTMNLISGKSARFRVSKKTETSGLSSGRNSSAMPSAGPE